LDQTAIIDDVEMAMSRGDVVIYKNQHYVWNNQWELLLKYDKNKDLELLNPATVFPFKKGYCQLIKGEKYYYMTTENVVN